MNSFHRPHAGLHDNGAAEEATRSPFSDLAGRFASWMTGADRMELEDPIEAADREAADREAADREPVGPEPERRDVRREPRSEASAPRPAPPEADDPSRFPLAPFGYNRTAVDEHLSTLERELEQLRAKHAPMASITEELERIGEQTASILVVAHDQAHETTRLAQEQAERCVADAAANAVAMTEQAKKRLRDVDNETDAIWRERERLLEDVRTVSAALANLADQASARFPAAEPVAPATAAFPAVAAPGHRPLQGIWNETAEVDLNGVEDQAAARDPQATEPFNTLEPPDLHQ